LILSIKRFTENYLIEFLIVNLFIASLSISSITNYSLRSFVLKLAASGLLWFMIAIDIKKSKFNFKSFVKSRYFKRLLTILIVFTVLLLTTLSYSFNPLFGAQKLLGFIISTIPTIIAFSYLLNTNNDTRHKVFIISITAASVFSVLLILILQPFSYHDMNIKNITSWSHVIYGRFIGPVYLIILFLYLNTKNRTLIKYIPFAFAVIIIGVYLSGMRAMILGITILTPITILISFLQKKVNVKNIAGLIAAIVVAVTVIITVVPRNEILAGRLENLQDVKNLQFNSDSPIHTRYHFYKISFEILKEYPILGVGFGGFRNYRNDIATQTRKYPHNLFLEFAVELGIPGILFCIFLLYLIFSSAKKVSTEVFIFFLFALWLAMFSKDISTQSLLWIGLAFVGVGRGGFRTQEAEVLINE